MYRRRLVRRARKPRRGLRRRVPRAPRIRGNPVPTFTEMIGVDLSGNPLRITANQGFKVGVKMNQVQQFTDYYSKLYNQYRILKISVLLLPEYTNFEQNQSIQNVYGVLPGGGGSFGGAGIGAPRIAWAINDSADDITVPTAEQQVLSCNGARVKMLTTSPWRCSFRPVPALQQTDLANNPVAVSKKYQWLSTSTEGQNVAHLGVDAFISALVTDATKQPSFSVYYKVTFQLKDPK